MYDMITQDLLSRGKAEIKQALEKGEACELTDILYAHVVGESMAQAFVRSLHRACDPVARDKKMTLKISHRLDDGRYLLDTTIGHA